VIALTTLVLGLAFGSFLNVCIYRLPLGMSVVNPPRSFCPKCNHTIASYDNVPVLSWLWLRGRCRQCQAAIPARYIVVELLTGFLFLACYLHFGLTIDALKYAVLGFLLLGLVFTDAETRLLPDKLTIPGLVLGLAFSLLVPVNDLVSQLLPGLVSMPVSSDLSYRLLSFVDAGFGASVGASFLYGAGAIYLRARGIEGMGFGDVKLMAMIGSFLGVKLTVLTIFAASVAGSLFGLSAVVTVWIKRRRRLIAFRHLPPKQAGARAWHSAKMMYRHYEMPFGVFLGSTAVLTFFFGNQFLHWYWGLM
jgi:leader peptidase (prepilin peptidase) / N-methyltransferase